MLKRSAPCYKVRSLEKGPALEGYGFWFNEITEDGVYGKESFSRDLKLKYAKKVFLLRDHDRTKVLALRGKNLELALDDKGLKFVVPQLPATTLSKETRELIKEGIVEGCSIGFKDIDSELKDGIREYKEIELHELSIVPVPYFETGKVSARKKPASLLPPECLI